LSAGKAIIRNNSREGAETATDRGGGNHSLKVYAERAKSGQEGGLNVVDPASFGGRLKKKHISNISTKAGRTK